MFTICNSDIESFCGDVSDQPMTKKRTLFASMIAVWALSLLLNALPFGGLGNLSDNLAIIAQALFVFWGARIFASLVMRSSKAQTI